MSSLINPEQDLTWLDDAACADRNWSEFFVEAGHTISPDVLALCSGCPVRLACLRHAYINDHRSGYFGGMSPGARKTMSLEQAERFIRTGRKPTRRRRTST